MRATQPRPGCDAVHQRRAAHASQPRQVFRTKRHRQGMHRPGRPARARGRRCGPASVRRGKGADSAGSPVAVPTIWTGCSAPRRSRTPPPAASPVVVETLGIGQRPARACRAPPRRTRRRPARNAATAGGMRMSRTWRVSERVKKRAVHTPDASARTARAGRRRRVVSVLYPDSGQEQNRRYARLRHGTVLRRRRSRQNPATARHASRSSHAHQARRHRRRRHRRPGRRARHPPGRPERFSL